MAGFNLLTLRLSSTLPYRELDLPLSHDPDFDSLAESCIPESEGGETILVFPPENLIGPIGMDGPRVLVRPGSPSAFATSVRSDPEGGRILALEAGLYAFMQWRARDGESLASGIEYFARQTWWEGMSCAGPWILRRVAEDGKIATQLLAKLSRQDIPDCRQPRMP